MKCPKCSHKIDVPDGNCVFCGYTPTIEEVTLAMGKIVFIIDDPGDPSVGIAAYTARVTLDDGFGYDEDDIIAIKKMLSEHYDVNVSQILTETEWNDFLKAEHEMYKQMSEERKEGEKLLIEHYEHCSGCAACEFQG